MKKIAIIGPPGAGKTTLARDLGPLLNMKVFHLDRLFWEPGWKGKSSEERLEILDHLVQEKQWIIEGTYLDSSEPRLNAADTIIFLNTSLLLCLWRIMQRHRKDHDLSRRDIPEGCTDRLTPFRILKVVIFPFRGRRKLEQKLREFPRGKVIRLSSPKQVKYYVAQLELHTEEKQQSSPSVVKERRLLAGSMGAATWLLKPFRTVSKTMTRIRNDKSFTCGEESDQADSIALAYSGKSAHS